MCVDGPLSEISFHSLMLFISGSLDPQSASFLVSLAYFYFSYFYSSKVRWNHDVGRKTRKTGKAEEWGGGGGGDGEQGERTHIRFFVCMYRMYLSENPMHVYSDIISCTVFRGTYCQVSKHRIACESLLYGVENGENRGENVRD